MNFCRCGVRFVRRSVERADPDSAHTTGCSAWYRSRSGDAPGWRRRLRRRPRQAKRNARADGARERIRFDGEAGLRDRSSAPRRVANRTAPDRVEAIARLRQLRFTAAEIAETLGNEDDPPGGLPASPLAPRPEATGFRWAA